MLISIILAVFSMSLAIMAYIKENYKWTMLALGGTILQGRYDECIDLLFFFGNANYRIQLYTHVFLNIWMKDQHLTWFDVSLTSSAWSLVYPMP